MIHAGTVVTATTTPAAPVQSQNILITLELLICTEMPIIDPAVEYQPIENNISPSDLAGLGCS
jgi:hypothetical protein